jgi:hypothetical protein
MSYKKKREALDAFLLFLYALLIAYQMVSWKYRKHGKKKYYRHFELYSIWFYIGNLFPNFLPYLKIYCSFVANTHNYDPFTFIHNALTEKIDINYDLHI